MSTSVPADDRVSLSIKFHGKIIDQLGIQMYQSPVAAIAELVSNAWDADAKKVEIRLPSLLEAQATIQIADNGIGMTFDECESRFLNIGYCRRGDSVDEVSASGRPILGRKGIGKFAGFGIATVIEIATVAASTGEKTTFQLKLSELRSDQYIATGKKISVSEYLPPDDARKTEHGTTITLSELTLKRRPSPDSFRRSMSRRFLLLQWAEGFDITVNSVEIPQTEDLARVEFSFPRDYDASEKPVGMQEVDGWGIEPLPNGKSIKWRIFFLKDPIDDEELRGISVFAKVKLAQKAFFFNLTGGLGGQHGLEYMCGQVLADYIDLQDDDLIATERQRINWEDESAIPLEEWGQERIKKLLRIWRDRRGEARNKMLEDKVSGFADRLDNLGKTECKPVKVALKKLGGIAALSDEQFKNIGDAIVTAAEHGRLKDLIDHLANTDDLNAENLLGVLVEEEVLTALSVAETVKTKLLLVGGLKDRIKHKELENAVRNYIAENPWLVDPNFQTYRVEISLKKFLADMASEKDIPGGKDSKRVDLVLASGDHLIVIEFMRPGLTLDYDHLARYELYFRTIKTNLEANTGGDFKRLTGIIVADNIAGDSVILSKVKSMRHEDMLAMDWPTLLQRALTKWSDFLDALASRTPQDPRLKALLDD